MPIDSGLNIVCIGGGTGLSTLLRGINRHSQRAGGKKAGAPSLDLSKLTAVVSVADDGGSSGKLRDEYDVLPPGDIRNCLLALADEEQEKFMSRLFSYRFEEGKGEYSSLGGHSLGNIILTALAEMNGGDFRLAIQEASRLLRVRGVILPPTLDRVVLCAMLEDGSVVEGESKIAERENRRPIMRVFFRAGNGKSRVSPPEPYKCRPVDEALEAIDEADAIILGPGSLYTSIIPNLLVEGIPRAIRRSKALKIYISNIMTEPGETDNYTLSMHVQAIHDHADFELDYVVANNQNVGEDLQKRYAREILVGQYESVKNQIQETIRDLDVGMHDKGLHLDKLNELSRKLKVLSDEVARIEGSQNIQVKIDSDSPSLQGIKIKDISMISEMEITEHGTKKRVARHDPDKLSQALIELLTNRS